MRIQQSMPKAKDVYAQREAKNLLSTVLLLQFNIHRNGVMVAYGIRFNHLSVNVKLFHHSSFAYLHHLFMAFVKQNVVDGGVRLVGK